MKTQQCTKEEQVTLRSAASFYLSWNGNIPESYQRKDVYLSTPL